MLFFSSSFFFFLFVLCLGLSPVVETMVCVWVGVGVWVCASLCVRREQITVAIQLCHLALELAPKNADGWHLLALLFSASRQYPQAVEACRGGLVEQPTHVGLQLTEIALARGVTVPSLRRPLARAATLVAAHFPSWEVITRPLPTNAVATGTHAQSD